MADDVDVTKEYEYVIEAVDADLEVKVEFAKTGSEPTPPVEDPDPPKAGAISAIGLAIGMITVGAGTVVLRKGLSNSKI